PPYLHSFPTRRSSDLISGIHIGNDRFTKLRTTQQGRSWHQTLEIISHSFGRNRTRNPLDDQVCSFCPAHITQHHFCRQNNRTRRSEEHTSELQSRENL